MTLLPAFDPLTMTIKPESVMPAENTFYKDRKSGYAGLDASGLLDPAVIPSFTALQKSTVGYEAYRAGSDTAGSGPYFNWANAAETRQWLRQLSASNQLWMWYYNGSAWTAVQKMDTDGSYVDAPTSQVGFKASRNGSDTAAAGPYFNMTNTAGTRQWLMQQSASNHNWLWYYDGATWTHWFTFGNDGSFGAETINSNGAIAVANGASTLTATGATAKPLTLLAGHAAYTGDILAINSTRTLSSAFNFIQLRANGVDQWHVAGDGHTYMGALDTFGAVIFNQSVSPASGAAGTAGQFTWDANYLYLCTASGVWKRVALTGGY